ncbi:prepilin peptidase-dependent pilin [Providencia rettgeri]|uniref:prepilin peptidase-dependent pilin n=1 Tax=Providencia TaxID=586 RepID=UPI000D704CDE|nr:MULTISPECIES: prepilin peptidase-dependent pilin [Providencia]AWS52378.1 prepilin peptidase-dependent pilin [Providencia rettgeri]EJD6476876.1 prepilin peptidase-dependent pilin [Providencia rettgeri]ELR5064992.1 prepilin peptidase-dependent pilin [Providencia rettgeri]ELR5165198.1 prepilin peptidase-dependent pilin [Providencia rettgeri]ELR5295901.1 prepilin peptidase-dependent pilin [Providencia rettgeri]
MNQQGFSLIEIMVVIAIISILSAIAIPGYQSYMQKAAITDVLQTVIPYKNSIEICSFNRGSLSHCNGGSDDIPTNITGKYINKIDVKSGVITFSTGKSLSDLKVTLTPTLPTLDKPFNWAVVCENKTNANLKSLCEKTFIF